ncbi:uncharacterized protein LOC130139368 [Syzygium oleosum]|uniref:uncharacterized protein LOC130139368 n=1 Tax=Syzygium oleosum TaxID=219896 RepID=UPI0024B890B6|nr:uncharacterized protein LOC130139368 [Syzygium oleosum]
MSVLPSLQVLRWEAELCSHLPVFPNLKLSKSMMSKPCFSHFDNLGIELYPSDDQDGAILDPASSCFGSHLRQIELYNAFLCEKEARVLQLLLKHTMVLEKFMIWPRWHRREQGIVAMSRKKLL